MKFGIFVKNHKLFISVLLFCFVIFFKYCFIYKYISIYISNKYELRFIPIIKYLFKKNGNSVSDLQSFDSREPTIGSDNRNESFGFLILELT